MYAIRSYYAFITDALEENGISNISTSGARIITSLDKQLQDRTLQALRRQLSQLDVRLRGYKHDEVQKEYEDLGYSGDDSLLPGNFVFGTIASLGASRENGPSRITSYNVCYTKFLRQDGQSPRR